MSIQFDNMFSISGVEARQNQFRWQLASKDTVTGNSSSVPVQKKTSTIKKTADVTATTLWLAVVGFFAYKTGLFNKKSPENIINQAKKIQTKYDKLEKMSQYNKDIDIDKFIDEKNPIKRAYTKTIYKLGDHFQNTKTKIGEELYNNLINSFGKLMIMPLVVWANPFGKKKTSDSDKISITVREPLSVLATFTLQGAFDKMFNIYMPKILDKNIFESKEIQEEFAKNGKVSHKNYEKIKYNPKETKRIFQELTDVSQENGGLKGVLTKGQAKKILTLNPFDNEGYDSYWRAFEREVQNGTIKKENLDLIKKKFKVVADSVGHYELAKIRPKIAMNIVVVVVISRIFLNVIHGKAMKLINHKEEEKK